MRKPLVFAGLAVAGLIITSSSHARPQAEAFQSVFGPCRGETCVISSNPGGNVRQFLAAASEILDGAKRMVVIDGTCASACVIFADVARERVCITRKARFAFHKATVFRAEQGRSGERMRAVARRDPVHSRDIAAWVHRNGGFPVNGMRVMNNREAGQFWRRCELRTR
jgi:hypothetical protein